MANLNKINENDVKGLIKCKSLSVDLIGIKKRCRSKDRHCLYIGYYDANVKAQDLVGIVREYIKANMRLVDESRKITINLTNYEIENAGGFIVKRFSSDDIFNRETLDISLEG